MSSYHQKTMLIAAVNFAVLSIFAGPNAAAQAKKPMPVPENHYKCYQVVDSEGFKPRGVKLKDQFMGSKAKVYRPILLCNPVSKNGERIPNREAHLVCYNIHDSVQPETRKVETSNQFGRSVLVVAPSQLLCVPSKKRELK